MFRFIHSADWQLGKRFVGFGENAERLRAQRLVTLRHAFLAARERAVDAFFVAGDLFEDSQVADSLVDETLRICADFPDVPVFLLPGNHDPASGPGAVWSRRQFRAGALPANVVILRESAAVPLPGGAVLLASPLTHKVSTLDPSLCLRDLARDQPADRVKIGLTHGSPAVPSQHQANDFPIDLAAATRAGLDYLGIGHWHGWRVFDQGRLVMPGTPEPDAFDQSESGFVAYVQIESPTAPPRVEQVPVGGLRWASWECHFHELDAARAALAGHVSRLGNDLATHVCRVHLKGPAALGDYARTDQWLRELFGGALHCQIHDGTQPILSPGEIAALEREHPILCQVLADLSHLELLATSQRPDLPAPSAAAAAGPVLTLAEAQALTQNARLELGSLDAADFLAARRLLHEGLQDAATAVCA